MSEAIKAPEMIYTLIPAIMADISAIGKDKKNQQQGFLYRGIDDVMSALKPLLAKHQVFTVPQVLEQARETKVTPKGGELRYSLLKVRFRFYAPDGSFVEAVTLGEGMDSGDKASNKAMSIAYKYALFQVFCIPTEEMQDPDAESHETAAPKAAPKAAIVQAAPTVPPEAFSAKAYLQAQADKLGISMADYAAYRKQLIAEGKAPDVPSGKMSREQIDALTRQIADAFVRLPWEG